MARPKRRCRSSGNLTTGPTRLIVLGPGILVSGGPKRAVAYGDVAGILSRRPPPRLRRMASNSSGVGAGVGGVNPNGIYFFPPPSTVPLLGRTVMLASSLY